MGFLFERTKEEYELAKIASRLKMAQCMDFVVPFLGRFLYICPFHQLFKCTVSKNPNGIPRGAVTCPEW